MPDYLSFDVKNLLKQILHTNPKERLDSENVSNILFNFNNKNLDFESSMVKDK